MHKCLDEFQFRPDSTTDYGVSYHFNGRNVVTTIAPSFSNRSFFILTGNKDNHKSLGTFDFPPDSTTDYRLAAIESLKNQCLHLFSVAVDLILF